jgi:hypothetical protein
MIDEKADGGQRAIKLALLTAAIGSGFAGTAQAAFTSESAGHVPVTFDLNGSATSDSIDLDGNATTDVIITLTTGTNISVQTGSNSVGAFAGYTTDFASLADFTSPTALKTESGAVPFVTEPSPGDFTDDFGGSAAPVTDYQEILFTGSGGLHYVGYLEDTFTTTSTDATLQLIDYGYNPVPYAVPEPNSLGLLAAGAAGLGVLRRRRARPR